MNILRLSTVALTIVLFTMGALILPVNTALAHCKGSHEGVDGCADPHGGNDGDKTRFMVEMQEGDVGGVVATGACAGTTSNSIRSVSFPEGCGTVTVSFITPPTAFPLILDLFALEVQATKAVLLFFTSDDGGIYVSDRVKASFTASETTFEIVVNKDNLNLTKNNQPDKGDVVGPFAVGTIDFTPIE